MPFTGNANDVSSSAHVTVPTNITYTTGKSGIANTAAVFNGTSSIIDVKNKPDLNLTKFSICALLKVNGFYTGQCQANQILVRGSNISPGPGYYDFMFSDNLTDSSCTITGDTNSFQFHVSSYNRQPWHKPQNVSPYIHTGDWRCVIMTYDSIAYRLYINGSLFNTFYPRWTTGPVGSSTDSITIGGVHNSTYPWWLNAVMDDLRLYNRALTTAEIDSLCGLLYINSNTPTTYCPDENFNLNYTTTVSYTTGNIFYAELSDATGSFSSPAIIGSVTSTTSGTIPCSMTTSPGTGYKIRVRSTTPVIVSDAVSITVNNNTPPSVSIAVSPSASVSKGTMVTYTATVLNGGSSPSYQWRKNKVNIAGATSATYKGIAGIDFTSTDSINVFVKSNNQCAQPDSAKSNYILVDISNGINQFASNDVFYAYPNPNKGAFTLKGKIESHETVTIEVVNTVGQILYTSETIPTNNMIYKEISLPNACNGMYYIRLHTASETQTLKLIVE
jgi:hypothetical protein